MKLKFEKYSPTENVTILVTDFVERNLQPGIAAGLLQPDSVGGEQVGYLEKPTLPGADARLQMMGGEFCGNATMSVGAHLARGKNLQDGEAVEFAIEVSGAEGLVPCRILRQGADFIGTVRMPLPEGIRAVALESDQETLILDMVVMPGISHVILPASAGIGRREIERRIRGWNEKIQADALGVLLYNAQAQAMLPLVYVASTDSAVWEHGCGSGTAALGSWQALRRAASYDGKIHQPGGEISVNALYNGERISQLTITGRVKLAAEGFAYV